MGHDRRDLWGQLVGRSLALVRVEVGPVPASSVQAFIDHASVLLAHEEKLPDDLAQTFAGYVQEWRALAAEGGDVVWTAEAPADVAEYLVHAFYRMAQRVDEARSSGSQVPELPPEAEAFYHELVRALLATMDAEGGGAAEFAEHLRSFWPHLDRD